MRPLLSSSAVLLPALLLLPAHASAAHWCGFHQAHPTDVALAKAIDASGGVTFDMVEATGAAYEAWDRQLNRDYRAVQERLGSGPAADAFRAAQRAWLAWDAAESRSNAILSEGDGTSATLANTGRATERRRARACDIRMELDAHGAGD